MLSRFDFVVFVILLAAMLGITTAFYTKQFTTWKLLWILWGVVLFWFFEIIGAASHNTLSENLVRSIPLPVLIGGTIVLCVILSVHWVDLWLRINGQSGVLINGGNTMPEWLFKILFFGLMIIQYVQYQLGALITTQGVLEMQTPEGFLLMTLGAFLAFCGNVALPQLLAKGLELVQLPEWAKNILQTALGAFFVALVTAIAQSPQFAAYIDKSLLSIIFSLASGLVTFAGTLVGRADGLYLRAERLQSVETIKSLSQ